MTVAQKTPDNNPKPGADKPKIEEVPSIKPAVKKSGAHWIFSKDTRLGRVNRSVVRTVGWMIAFFALGFLAVYLLLYVPLSQDYDKLAQAYVDSQQQLKTAQAGFKSTQEASRQVQAALDQTKISKDVLDINNQVLQIELAIAQHDQQGAAYYLKQMQISVGTALPEVNKIDPDLANVLDARVKVVAAELSNDPKAAQADLEVIIKYLQTIMTRVAQ